MNTIKSEQLLAQLNWRYATNKFDPARKISPEDWAVMEEALILSASSYGCNRGHLSSSLIKKRAKDFSFDLEPTPDFGLLAFCDLHGENEITSEDIDRHVARTRNFVVGLSRL